MTENINPGNFRVALISDQLRAAITFLSWDTEGGERVQRNLLRDGEVVRLHLRHDGDCLECATLPASRRTSPDDVHYQIALNTQTNLEWHISSQQESLTMRFSCDGPALAADQTLELVFPFDPGVTATTLLPAQWLDDGRTLLPALVHAPDWGQLLLASDLDTTIARLEGNYDERVVDLVIELGHLASGECRQLSFIPYRLPQPKMVPDRQLWQQVRRGWYNALEPLADCTNLLQVGVSKVLNREIHPAGMMGNEVISGCATCSLWFYADHILWLPQLAPSINASDLLRRTLDIILKTRLGRDGSLVCYWMARGDYSDFLDSHPSMLISVWDYVECTGDLAWLERNLGDIELIADFLVRRDVDHDGLVEAVQSGNSGTLLDPIRGCSWWDAINAGHKDGYSNALIYRGWLCLADLEERLGRAAQADHWRNQALKLKEVYALTLMNPSGAWLGWWRSADGQLHDLTSPLINAMAIEYGLVDAHLGRKIMDNLQHKIAQVVFRRPDLGMPSILTPIPKMDYLLGYPPGACGTPGADDGSDTFGQYMNGGIHAGHTLPYLAALYLLGHAAEADAILSAMIARQQLGLFQNGVWGKSPFGGEWTTWEGQPSGADGYLADNYRFLQAVFLREPACRARLYRPLGHVDACGLAT
jgi:hypothetical protein